jgi:hypothetical protein
MRERDPVTVTAFAPPFAYSCRFLPLRHGALGAAEVLELLEVPLSS